MQLCAELYLAGTTAVYHIPSSRGYDKYDIPDNVATCVYVVDAPANTTAFKRFLSKAVKEGLTVVVAIRSNEWAIIKDSLFDDLQGILKIISIGLGGVLLNWKSYSSKTRMAFFMLRCSWQYIMPIRWRK